MKKIILILTLIIEVFIYKEIKNNEVIIPDTAIRLRVIPNSNSVLDQNMKNKVKKYLENNTYNLIKDEDSKEVAREKIKNNIPKTKEDIEQIFNENNYNMNFSINYGLNYFPEKEYRGLKYEEGYYESVVISIGKAEGDNWWCVLFPNLCLVDLENTNDVEYKSENDSEVSETEIQNILTYYKRLGRNEDRYVESFDSIASLSSFLPGLL